MEDLLPFQEIGAGFLARSRFALLADEMGLGKSAQAIAGADTLGAKTILVLGPASLRVNWLREFDKFSPLDRPAVAIHCGKDRPLAAGVTVCSYDLLAQKAVREKLLALRPDVLVLDEAHYLKNRKAQRTKAIFGKEGLAHNAGRIWALTGTPAPNNPAELWPLLHAFGVYPKDYWSFLQRFCTGFDNGFTFSITGGKNLPQLRALLAQVMLRRKKDEVMKELPPIRYADLTIEPGDVDEEIYFPDYWRFPHRKKELAEMETAIKGLLDHVPGDERKSKVLGPLSTPMASLRRYTGMAKLKNVAAIVKAELDAGVDKIVLFCVHRDVIMSLRDLLRDYGPVLLFGGTPANKRQAAVDKFQGNPRCRLFIGQIAAAGTGITLTAAAEVLFVESSWVPAENAQASMRCHRIGQSRPVRVRFVGLAGSVDEQVQKVLRRKTQTLAELFD